MKTGFDIRDSGFGRAMWRADDVQRDFAARFIRIPNPESPIQLAEGKLRIPNIESRIQ
jgi:hypothetical protein